MSDKPGLSIEVAAGVTARDLIAQHFRAFYLVMKTDRAAGKAAVAAYIDGLAGAMALTIAGGHGSYWEVMAATEAKLREAVDRDLKHLKPQ